MRTTRAWFGMAVLTVALAALGGCAEMSQRANNASAADAAAHGGSAPAGNRSGVFVQVSPSTASPGSSVQIRASCVDNTNSATVTSPAFGTVTVQPWNTLLLAEVTIPASTRSGRFDVTITCRTGSTATTSRDDQHGAAATATAAPAPATRGPNTGGGYLARHGGAATAVVRRCSKGRPPGSASGWWPCSRRPRSACGHGG